MTTHADRFISYLQKSSSCFDKENQLLHKEMYIPEIEKNVDNIPRLLDMFEKRTDISGNVIWIEGFKNVYDTVPIEPGAIHFKDGSNCFVFLINHYSSQVDRDIKVYHFTNGKSKKLNL